MLPTKWYPNLRLSDQELRNAIRRILDFIYELRDNLSPVALYAKSNLQLTIGTKKSNIPGCLLTLTRPGTWLVTGAVTIINDSDAGKLFTVSLRQGGDQLLPQARLTCADAEVHTITQQWLVTVSRPYRETNADASVSLEIIKEDTATGDSTAEKEHCTLSATWQGSSA